MNVVLSLTMRLSVGVCAFIAISLSILFDLPNIKVPNMDSEKPTHSTKSYTVGIPRLISFDFNVSINRKCDKNLSENTTPREPFPMKEIVIPCETPLRKSSSSGFIRSPRLEPAEATRRGSASPVTRIGAKRNPPTAIEVPTITVLKPREVNRLISDNARRPRNISMPSIGSANRSNNRTIRIHNNEECLPLAKKIDSIPLKRTLTQYNRDMDGLYKEMEECDLLMENPIVEVEEEEKEEAKEIKKGSLYPNDHVNHSAVKLYEDGVINLRLGCFEIDHPETNFCFHCDRIIVDKDFTRRICHTEYRPDLIYGVLRCKVYRDLSLCPWCTKTCDSMITVSTKAKGFFDCMYPAKYTKTNK